MCSIRRVRAGRFGSVRWMEEVGGMIAPILMVSPEVYNVLVDKMPPTLEPLLSVGIRIVQNPYMPKTTMVRRRRLWLEPKRYRWSYRPTHYVVDIPVLGRWMDASGLRPFTIL